MTLDKNDFLREKTLFSQDSLYSWPSDLTNATLTLQQVPYSPSKEHFIDVRPLLDSGEEIIENKTESWSFDVLTKSALYCFLHEKISIRKQIGKSSLSKFDWLIIVPILLNSSINKEIIIFLDDYYNVPNDFKIIAAHFALKRISLFNRLIMTEKSLNDFLVFLKIDPISRKTLVKTSFQNKNFKKLTDFLFVFNCSLNQDLTLSNILRNYKYFNKNDAFFKTLEYKDQLLSEVFELKLANLEDFASWDVLESSEFFKSKSSELLFFSFYELLLDNSNTSANLDFIEIFQLFEKFLYDAKDKSVFLAEISLEKSSQFYTFLEKFYSAYQQTIIKILSKQIKLLKKFSKKEIPYAAIGMGSIFGFFALLSILGMKPPSLNSERKPLIPTQTGCFATLSAQFQYGVNVNRLHSEPSLPNSTNVSVSVASLENNKALVQRRPTPKAIISYSLPKGGQGAAVFKQSNLTPLQEQEEVKVFVPENYSFFKGMSPEKCLDLLVEDISKKCPNCYVTIRQKYGTINQTVQKLNEITISGTVGQYSKLGNLKKEVIQATKCTNDLIVLSGFKKLDRDHTLNTKLRAIFQITEGRGACVFVEKVIHDKLGRERNYLAPPGLGYLPGEGGSIAIIDDFDQQDKKIIENFKNDVGMCEGLESINFSEKDLINSYQKAHNIDRDLILNNIEKMGSSSRAINENSHLAIVQDNYLNENFASQMDSLVIRTKNYPKQDLEKLGSTVSQVLETGKAQREDTHAIKDIVPTGTTAYQNILTSERKVINSAEELVSHVEGLGAIVDSDIKNDFFAKKSSNLLTPQEAYDQAADTHGLANFEKTQSVVPAVGSNSHVPRYPKLK